MRDLGGGWRGGEASPAARRRPPWLSPEVKTIPICWGPETWLEDATELQKTEPGLAIQVSPLTSPRPFAPGWSLSASEAGARGRQCARATGAWKGDPGTVLPRRRGALA